MKPFILITDMPGKRFGKLLVLDRAANSKWSQTRWLCQCDCGNTCTVVKAELIREKRGTRSCGCLRTIFRKHGRKTSRPPGKLETSIRAFLPPDTPYDYRLQQKCSSIKRHAYAKGREWALSNEQLLKLILSPCTYCGVYEYLKIGVDRIDASAGYTPENSAPCCKTCNFAKNNLTLPQFKTWLARAAKHLLTG